MHDLLDKPSSETTPIRRPNAGARVWAGAVMLFGALGLILLGGCFLIGVLLFTVEVPGAPEQHVLLITLYGLAFACFAGALVLLIIGVSGLAKVLRGSGESEPRRAEEYEAREG